VIRAYISPSLYGFLGGLEARRMAPLTCINARLNYRPMIAAARDSTGRYCYNWLREITPSDDWVHDVYWGLVIIAPVQNGRQP